MEEENITLHRLFDKARVKYSDYIAVEYYDDNLIKSEQSYEQLHEFADNVKTFLNKYVCFSDKPTNIVEEDCYENNQDNSNKSESKLEQRESESISLNKVPKLIGVFISPCLFLPGLIIGILRSGCYFAPINPSSPAHIIARFVQQVGLKYILTHRNLLETLSNVFSSRNISFKTTPIFPGSDNFLISLCTLVNVYKKNAEGSEPVTQLAYMLTTSGTTGDAKVVYVPHKCILPNILHIQHIFKVTCHDKVAMCSPLTFDPSIVELFIALSNGATIVLVSDIIKMKPSSLIKAFFCLSGVTIMQPTPSLFNQFAIEDLRNYVFSTTSNLRILAFGGEACPSYQSIKRWIDHAENNSFYDDSNKIRFVNLYGITEVSSWATWYELPICKILQGSDELISIGLPLHDTVLDVVNENEECLCKIECVTTDEKMITLNNTKLKYKITFYKELIQDENQRTLEGYLRIGGKNRICFLENLTKNLMNHHHHDSVQLDMRNTGDIVKLMIYDMNSQVLDSNLNQCFISEQTSPESFGLYYMGRTDGQIKRHGKKLNLLYVKQKLEQLSSVSAAYVMNLIIIDKDYKIDSNLKHCRDTPSYSTNNKRLVAFVVPVLVPNINADDNLKEIMRTVQEFLEAYCVPDEYIVIDKIPVTAHGKTDTKMLLKHLNNQKTRSCLVDRDINISHIKHTLIECWNEALPSPITSKGMFAADNVNKHSSIVLNTNRSFIECGGDSFAAVRFISLLERKLSFVPLSTMSDLLQKVLNNTLIEVLNYFILTLVKQKSTDVNSKITTGNTKPGMFKSMKAAKQKRFLQDEAGFSAKTLKLQVVSTSTEKASLYITLKSFRRGGLQHEHTVKNITQMFLNQTIAKSNFKGNNGDQVAISKSQGFSLKEVWKYNTGKCIDASPLVVSSCDQKSGLVIIGSHSFLLVCVNLATGVLFWKTRLGGRIESSACLTSCGNYVVVGCYDKSVYCVNPENGSILWKFETGGEVKSSPCPGSPESSTVYVGSHDGYIYSLNMQLNCVLWKHFCGGGAIFSSPCLFSTSYQENALSLYACTLSGKVVSLDGSDGSVRWNKQLTKPIFSSPSASKFGLCIGCVDNNFYMLSHHSGNILWRYAAHQPIFSSPSFHSLEIGSVIMVGSHDGRVYCVDAEKGSLSWSYPDLETEGEPVYSTPYPFDFIPEDGMGDMSEAHAMVASASTDGVVTILDLRDGQRVVQYKLPGHVFSSPIVIQRTLETNTAFTHNSRDSCHHTCYYVLVGCRDDNVYCLKLCI